MKAILVERNAEITFRKSARAGHSSTKVTADIYAHMIQLSNRAAADKLGEILG